MATNTVHVNDVGVVFLITIQDENGVVDITTAQAITLYFQKPDKTIISRPCNTVTASQGLVRYVSATGDFNQAGKWRLQVVIMFADGSIKHSDVGSLTVSSNISP